MAEKRYPCGCLLGWIDKCVVHYANASVPDEARVDCSKPHEPHLCEGHPTCDLPEDHDGDCWFESGTEDD